MNTPLENTKINQGLNKNFYFLAIVLSILGLLLSYIITMSPEIALVVAALISLLFIFYQRTDIGLNITIIAIIAGQLIKTPLGESGGAGILLTDLLIPLLMVTWLIKKIINKEKIIRKSIVTPYLLIFLGMAAASLIGGVWLLESSGQALVSLLYLARLIAYSFLFFIGLDIFRKEKNVRNYKITLLVTFFLFALLGILQLEYFPKLGNLSIINQGWDPHIRRLFSTFLDPNFAGAFLSIGAIVSLSLFYYAKALENKLILIALFALQFYALILTYSRSSYILFAISFIVFALMRSKKLFVLGLIATVVVFVQYPRAINRVQDMTNLEQFDESAGQRLISWERSSMLIQDYPIFGIGYNTYRYAQIRYGFIEDEGLTALSGAGSDSSILTILVTTGAVGLISYILFYLASIKQAWALCKKYITDDRNAMAFALMAILVGFVFHSIFVNSLLYPFIMITIFTLLAVVASKSRLKQ